MELGKHLSGLDQELFDEDLRNSTQPMPTEQELQSSYVAPGRSAQLQWSVCYHAYWKNESDGMARHARNQVRALASTGLPVRLQSMGQRVILNEELAPEVKDLLYLEGISSSYTAISVKQFIFDTPDMLREAICPVGIRNSVNEDAVDRILRSTIVYTSWERDVIHRQFVQELNKLGQVWVPCEANRKAFAISGVNPDRLKVVPYTFDPNDHAIAAPRGFDSVPDGKRFYHIGKWEPRKNQHRLLGAFLLAFTPKDKASLFIKTSGFGLPWANYPTYEESLDYWLSDPRVVENSWDSDKLDRLVRVVSDKVSSDDLNQIHKRNNIYVSSGLGEAWDLPAFDAKMAGNRLVYVGYGGPDDFAEEEDVKVSWDEMTDVHPGYLWEPNARWASVSVEALASALKQALPVEERLVPRDYCRRFSHHSVAQIMERNLRELSKELGCWERLVSAGGFG